MKTAREVLDFIWERLNQWKRSRDDIESWDEWLYKLLFEIEDKIK